MFTIKLKKKTQTNNNPPNIRKENSELSTAGILMCVPQGSPRVQGRAASYARTIENHASYTPVFYHTQSYVKNVLYINKETKITF